MSATSPEQLYRPSPKDLLAQFAPVAIRRSQSSSAAAAAVSLQSDQSGGYIVPIDYVFVGSWVQVGGSGGGGQTCSRVTLDINDDNQNTIMRLIDENPAAPQTTVTAYHAGKFIVFGGEVLLASAFFNAGVAANAIRSSFCGILVPRANWQRA